MSNELKIDAVQGVRVSGGTYGRLSAEVTLTCTRCQRSFTFAMPVHETPVKVESTCRCGGLFELKSQRQ